jgi:hypothetical protein
MSDKHGFTDMLAMGKVMRGWCLGAMGRATEGIPWLLEGIAIYRATGANLLLPFSLMRLAEVCGKASDPQEGLARLAEAARVVETTQERWTEAEIHRLRGTLLRSWPPPILTVPPGCPAAG